MLRLSAQIGMQVLFNAVSLKPSNENISCFMILENSLLGTTSLSLYFHPGSH
jgi:hypothetical protein